jgi:hypothetical protein
MTERRWRILRRRLSLWMGSEVLQVEDLVDLVATEGAWLLERMEERSQWRMRWARKSFEPGHARILSQEYFRLYQWYRKVAVRLR